MAETIKPFAQQTKSNTLKAIVINEFVKFSHKAYPQENFKTNDQLGLETVNLYRNGYWNVFCYSQELEAFLKKHEIAYRNVTNDETV